MLRDDTINDSSHGRIVEVARDYINKYNPLKVVGRSTSTKVLTIISS